MFVSLGLRNVWRNKGRTVLGIVSMAVAAIVFASSSVLSQGYPAGASRPARELLAGDLVFLPGKTVLSPGDLSTADLQWGFGKKSLDQPSGTIGFDVTPYYYGHIEETETKPGQEDLCPQRLNHVVEELRSNSDVAGVTVKRSIPFLAAFTRNESDQLIYGFLEARDVSQDLDQGVDLRVSSGRYLTPDDGDSAVGVACLGWPGGSLPGAPRISLQVPRRWENPTGDRCTDYEDPVSVSIAMVGAVRFQESSPEGTITYANPTIFVTEEAFDRIASQAGYAPEETVWGISVRLHSIASLENMCAMYQRQYNDFTVVSGVRLASARINRTSMPVGTPMDMRKVTETLAFLTAALLSATNLAVLMLQRKTEIGILRSLGATGWNVTCMVLTEVIFIALIGALLGSLLVQPSVAWTLASNKIEGALIANQVLSGLGKTLCFAVLASSVFGILPVAKALRVTPSQVLRGE